MVSITQKRKLSKSAWALILILFIAVITLIVVAFLGLIDLSPLSNGYLSIFTWASSDIVNGIIIGLGFICSGILVYYVVIKYFIGNKVTTNTAPIYTPQGQTLSQPPQTGTETVIS